MLSLYHIFNLFASFDIFEELSEICTEEKLAPVQEESSKNTTAEKYIPTQEEATEKILQEGNWICGKCKSKNLISRNDCWSCGSPKAPDKTTFVTTENGTIICSNCKFEQPSDRSVCWNCGVKFQ